MSQAKKYSTFKELHTQGNPLVLYNIWDAGTAKAVAEGGAKAIATGSAGVALAKGYADGEDMPFTALLETTEQIAKTVDLPCSIDFEAGYADDLATLADNTKALIKAGAVGINFEDWDHKAKQLRSVEDQCKRIKAIQKAADETGVPLFINARTDVFIKADKSLSHTNLIPQAIERAHAYKEAGADCLFTPALLDPALIKELCEKSPIPVNIILLPGAPSIAELTEAGVGRISYGPVPYRQFISTLTETAQKLYS